MMKRADVAKMIDHTLLKPEATRADVQELAKQAAQLGTYSICISPSLVPIDMPEGVKLAVVVGFPSGAVPAPVKAAEAAHVAPYVDEIDMVINLALAKSHDWDALEAEIAGVRAAAPDAVLKVIIESAALTEAEIVGACQSAERAGADFVKTSTGFHPAGGASTEAVALMRQTVGDRLGVKASGGIRTAADARAMIDAGASRLGLSASEAILQELPE